MPGSSGSGVSEEQEVQISFARSKDGRKRSIPVWFSMNQGKMELLPMYGLKTKWYVDVQKSGSIGLKVGGWEKTSTPKFVRDSKTVEEIKRRFSVKYGEEEVKRYYPTSEIALEIAV
jgi:uncharacterized protein DUF2255